MQVLSPIIDEITHNGKKHYVYSKSHLYWIISVQNSRIGMFSVLIEDLKLSKKQLKEQDLLTKL